MHAKSGTSSSSSPFAHSPIRRHCTGWLALYLTSQISTCSSGRGLMEIKVPSPFSLALTLTYIGIAAELLFLALSCPCPCACVRLCSCALARSRACLSSSSILSRLVPRLRTLSIITTPHRGRSHPPFLFGIRLSVCRPHVVTRYFENLPRNVFSYLPGALALEFG
ncbi:hypothetical protein F4803DRAFT_66477 [Xylaria telfairii]|nr:hypothetical protein F4803DRAFT_66477 [Xylaria telfairii]